MVKLTAEYGFVPTSPTMSYEYLIADIALGEVSRAKRTGRVDLLLVNPSGPRHKL